MVSFEGDDSWACDIGVAVDECFRCCDCSLLRLCGVIICLNRFQSGSLFDDAEGSLSPNEVCVNDGPGRLVIVFDRGFIEGG